MDQDQAIALLDNVTSQQKLTRQEHAQVQLALELLRELSSRFREMTLANQAQMKLDEKHAVKKRVNPEITAPSAKDPIDNADRSEA